MTPEVKFTKMHGAGNDYIYVNAMLFNIPDPEAAAIKWSDRHKGIGSDGLVMICKPTTEDADYRMRIFNADGSEAMMCGNASRCIGKYLYEKGICKKDVIRLETLSGIKVLNLHVKDGKVESVTVDMLEPALKNPAQFDIDKAAMLPEGTFVSMGNPHYVIFTGDISKVNVEEEGKKLEFNPAFPERCNIEFAQVLSDGSLRTRVWERGSGITMACGTGACATAVAAALTGHATRESRIIMDGGELNIKWSKDDNHVYMTGPAEFAFDGTIKM